MKQFSVPLEWLILTIEVISTLILLTGFVRATAGFVSFEIQRTRGHVGLIRMSYLRRYIGTYILLGLDFYIVADIIASMLRPELNDLASLAVIVLLRTTIGYFLGKELAEIRQADPEEDQSQHTP